MLTSIRVENFKGIEGPIEIAIKPVTLLFGANSVGKSSILHALHFIRGVLENFDLDPTGSPFAGEAIDLGGFKNLLHMRERGRRMVLSFGLDLSRDDLPEYGQDHQPSISDRLVSSEIEFAFSIDDQSRVPLVDYYFVKLNGTDAVVVLPDDVYSKDGRRRIAHINLLHPLLESMSGVDEDNVQVLCLRDLIFPSEATLATEILDEEEQRGRNRELQEKRTAALSHPAMYSVQLRGFDEGVPSWGKAVSVVSDNRGDDVPILDPRVLSELVVGSLEMLKELLTDGRAVGPLRMIPPRRSAPSNRVRGENWYSGLAAWQRLNDVSDPAVLDDVNTWLADSDKLDTNYRVVLFKYKEVESAIADSFSKDASERSPDLLVNEILEVENQSRIYLKDMRGNIRLTPHDVGVGLSQLIPVVVAAVDRASSLILIEQPELHVHPRIQVGLGDLFVTEAKKRDCNFIIETHSEALLLRILKRMRQTANGDLPLVLASTTADDVAIHLVQNTGKGVVVTPIEITDDGEFVRPWPGGFFEETLKETF